MNTYIDVSHIMGWQGVLTGIERVEYHLIKYYANNTNAKYIYWDTNKEIFVEFDKHDIADRVLSKSDDHKHSLRTINRFKKLVFKTKKAIIKKDDVLIILAGLWDNDKYIDAVTTVNTNIVHVVYDMIPIVQPAYVVDFVKAAFYSYMTKVMVNVNLAMSISKSTQDDLVAVLKKERIELPHLDTFRLGDDPFGDEIIGHKPNRKIPKEFFLSVGTIEARKNHTIFYYAYKSAKSQSIDLPKLVIAGKRGWLSEDIQKLIENDPDINSQIIIIDKIDDSALVWLYNNTMLSIFPSFYEGWGLPVAESLMCGKVTLASNTSSIPEVGTTSVDYFSPFSTDQLLNLMVKYSSESARLKREKEISYMQTTWAQTGQEFFSKTISALND